MTAATAEPLKFDTMHSLELEQCVLAVCMLAPGVAPRVIGEDGVRPGHFVRDRHRLVMAAIEALSDRGSEIDRVTVIEQLRQTRTLQDAGGPEFVTSLLSTDWNVASIRQYAQDLVAYARWRHRHSGAYAAALACQEMNEEAYLAAEQLMTADMVERSDGRHMSSEEAAHALIDRLQGDPEPRIPVPMPGLSSRMSGGLRRGQLTAIIGPGHHGKSVLCDMLVQTAAQAGARVGLYLNEMSTPERVERFACRMSGVGLDWISAAAAGTAPLSAPNAAKVTSAMGDLSRLPIEFINASGWTGRDVIRHANRLNLDLLAFDIVQRLPFTHQQRRFDMDEAIGHFDQYAKRTGCHVLYTSHISRERTRATGEVPPPLMSDVSESKMLVDLPDNVIAFWRRQDDKTKDPTDEGIVKLLKARAGKLGGFNIDFDGAHQVMVEQRSLHAVAS